MLDYEVQILTSTPCKFGKYQILPYVFGTSWVQATIGSHLDLPLSLHILQICNPSSCLLQAIVLRTVAEIIF